MNFKSHGTSNLQVVNRTLPLSQFSVPEDEILKHPECLGPLATKAAKNILRTSLVPGRSSCTPLPASLASGPRPVLLDRRQNRTQVGGMSRLSSAEDQVSSPLGLRSPCPDLLFSGAQPACPVKSGLQDSPLTRSAQPTPAPESCTPCPCARRGKHPDPVCSAGVQT